jgi:hypothetical protein
MKNFSSLLLCLAVLFSVSTASAQNNVSTWDGSAAEWTQGSGTQASPYLIESAQNLAWIAEMVNGGITTYANTWFKLTTDLDMNNVAWVPIGNSTTNLFCGKFDGDNHFIDNISITGNYTYTGLFGITGDGFICENLGVKTTNTYVRLYAGGIVAYINGANSVIQNCYNTGTIRGVNAGGIVGLSNVGSTIINVCFNEGAIISQKLSSNNTYQYRSGGIAGGGSGTIQSCYNIGNITCTLEKEGYVYAYTGGIVGSGFTISHCYNEGDINLTLRSSWDAGSKAYSYAGGISGSGNPSYCYNKGNISSSSCAKHYASSNTWSVEASSHAGGITGVCATNSSPLIHNHNTGMVSSTAYTWPMNSSTTTSYGSRTSYAGGICGSGNVDVINNYNCGEVNSTAYYYDYYGSQVSSYNDTKVAGGIKGDGTGTIKNCYNAGFLTSGGGIRGTTNGTVTNCYYLSTCGGAANGGTSKTEAVMKSSSFPILLNADSTVYIMDGNPNVNNGYPIFGDGTYSLTQNANPISFHTANLNGIYYGSADVAGFEYMKSSDSKYTTVYTNVGSPASYQLTGLSSGTEYTYRFFVQKNGLTIYGGDKTFTTLACDLQVSIAKSPTSICQGETATLTASGISTHSNAFTYLWNNNSTANQIQVMDGSTYTVTVHDTNSCSATASTSITVNPVPQGNISGNTNLCAGQSTTLTASGANSYHWSTGATSPVITVNSSGNYVCTFTNSYGCTTIRSVIVNVFSTPSITGNTSFCSGGYTTLTATGGDTYQWSTGATTASINVSTAGNYSVTASTNNGCSGSASVNVVQNQPVNVTITGNSVICSEIGTTLTATSGASYQWSSGQTTQSISVNTPGNYSVTVTNNNGCSGSSSQAVTMMEQAVISGNTHICQGENTTLSVSGTGTYTWSTGSHASSVTVSTPGNYIVTASLPNGCSSTASANVTVGTTPTPSILGNTVICQGQSTTLTANGGTSYVWSNASTNNSINVSQSGVYTVTATNAEGCSNTANVTVTVNPLPNVSIIGNSSFCQGDNVTLTATGANSYAWNNTATNASITVSSAGTYTVTGTNVNGCSNTASKTVTVNPTYNIPLIHSICQGESYNFYGQNITAAGSYTHTLQTVNGCDSIITLTVTVKNLPTPSILGNTVICQGQSTTLTANGGTSYVWSNASTNNCITVSQNGVYTVTATNTEGCSNTANVTVTVNPLPNVNISGNSSFCQGDNVTLTATGANTYVWSNASSNASITVNSAGNYTVTGTDANGCSNTATKTITVNPTYSVALTHSMCESESYNFYGQNITTAGTYTHTLQTVNGCDSVLTLTVTMKALPTATITGNTTLCESESTTLTANGGISYVWNNASTNSSINVSQSGVYTVTATNAEGCSNTANVTVTVNPLPNVSISGNNGFCQGDNVTLTVTGANTYVWSNASTNASITVSSAGNYTVTGTDANGCSNTATKTVAVNPTYNVALTHDMCEGESYNFYGQNITTAGTYTHTLQTVNGCDSVLTLTITVKPLPTPSITGNTTLCEGESTTLTANGGTSYAWSNDATSNSISVSQSGIYTVTATNAEGCSNTANVTVTVNPLPAITIGGNTTVCAGSSTTLTASGANTYSWSTGDNTSSVTINAFGVYTVTGTSPEGCSNSASVTVLVSQLPNITITGETDICAGESTTLTANGGETYLWSDGTTDNVLTVSTAGTYQVIGYNAAGCNAMASATVNVWQPATSEFTITTPDSCYEWNAQTYCTSGDYTQTLETVHGCDSVVTMHLTITVGINDHDGFDFTVYPNPTTGVVNVQITNHNSPITEFYVYDAFGKLIRMVDGVGANNYSPLQTAQIDLSGLANGVYFVKGIVEGNVVAVRKVVKR